MITLWIIGYLFTTGLLENKRDTGFLRNFMYEFVLFFSWPYDMGVFVRQYIKEQR